MSQNEHINQISFKDSFNVHLFSTLQHVSTISSLQAIPYCGEELREVVQVVSATKA
jgi:hypothetical protein